MKARQQKYCDKIANFWCHPTGKIIMSLAGKKSFSALAAVLLPIKPLNWCVVCAIAGPTSA
ncbi:coenzyme A biosynthesis bifunctional CoaBC domain protein [Escherichia coli EPECa12]|nr:flavo domain protein [Shigella flexneri 4343-70]EGX20320.1 flavo domain protein [Escherichia coli TX1999]EHV52348.1 coenzyme A biosynthesis CoaBC protein [Escherichia coli DEC6A]EHV74614.1 coenzyme A biosynthesis CoaBC protein [Escherichia coli DEC7A]EHW23703.1 DNA synthesis flavoprotein [Escherichia coli DEC8E]EHW74299.1 DNA synthesis flavoprotein [Escherichia coli DEC10D]EIQ03732.1 coenzyme A biosynthesis bifunctional CoaBC domain protein [Shigella flexneri 2850-71]EIQ59813.1 coenzyme A